MMNAESPKNMGNQGESGLKNLAGDMNLFPVHAVALLSPLGRAFFGRMKKYAITILAAASALTAGAADLPAPVKLLVLDDSVLCVQASHVPENIPDQIRMVAETNHLTGTVLDLRFANGAATNAGAYFAQGKAPLVVLVNSQTRGPAAALAAQLRTSSSAILIGTTNSPGNLLPDILVSESTDEEKKFQENPFYKPATNSPGGSTVTNNLLALIDHTSEADLVRKRIKDGEDDGTTPTPRTEPAQPVVRDPALARAVDLLKALAVLHPTRG